MSYRYERRRGRMGCLKWMVAVVWIVLLAVLAYRFLFRDQISELIGNQIGGQLRGDQTDQQVGDQLRDGAAGILPTAIAGLPSGELRVTEAQANSYLAARAASLGPIQSVAVRFVPGEVQAEITAMGTTSTARMGLAVQDGRIIVVDPRLDGVLGQVISVSELTGSLERQINDQLAAQGRRATDVRVEQGQLVVTIEG